MKYYYLRPPTPPYKPANGLERVRMVEGPYLVNLEGDICGWWPLPMIKRHDYIPLTARQLLDVLLEEET